MPACAGSVSSCVCTNTKRVSSGNADTYGIEDTGALVVVQVGVEVVDANGVDTHDLQKSGITQAGIGIAERILARLGVVSCTAAGLVRNTNKLELVAVIVNEVGSLDRERLDGSHDGGGKSHKSRLHLWRVRVNKCVETRI